MMRRVFLSFLAALAIAGPAFAQPAAPKRILFVGNSLTYWTDVPARVARLAEAMGRKAVVSSQAYPAYSLEDHWNDGRALTEIKKGWDVVVLQQGTSAQDDSRANLVEFAKKFNGPIRASGAKPAIYMSWPLVDRPKDFAACILAHRQAAQGIDATLLPVGEAWLRALSKEKRLKLYADAIHPSSIGSDLIVLTIFFGLFPAGPQEFTEAYVARIAKALEMQADQRDLFFDAATRAIDEPLQFKE
jgi:hypothetical protein